MDFLKKNWKFILGALIVILAIIAFWPHKAANDHTVEKKTIDSLILVVNALKKSSNAKIYIDSTTAVEAKRKADSLQLTERIWYARAKTNEASAKYYELLYTQAKDKKDPDAAYSACDQIIQIADSQSRIINTLHALGDSIEVQTAIQINSKDSIIQTTQVLLKATETALNDTKKAYDGISTDYSKQVKANKRNKTLVKILAGIGVVLAGIIIAK